MPKVEPPAIPTLRYVRYLGPGGYSEVFLYRPAALSSEVGDLDETTADTAVKVLLDGHPVDEARKMLSLVHPNVVRVYDISAPGAQGLPWLRMEYCSGGSLAQWVERAGRLPDEQRVQLVLEWGVQLGGALQYVHDRGVVHRDVKPANILLSSDGVPKLTDFGIAADLADAGNQQAASVQWSSPEVLDRGVGSRSSDIYSLAATLWTLLFGRSPFAVADGDNSRAALQERTLAGNIRPIGRWPAIEHVLLRAMALQPGQRYDSARAFAAALDALRTPADPPPGPTENVETRSARSQKVLGGILAVAVAAGVIVAAVTFVGHSDGTTTTTAVQPQPPAPPSSDSPLISSAHREGRTITLQFNQSVPSESKFYPCTGSTPDRSRPLSPSKTGPQDKGRSVVMNDSPSPAVGVMADIDGELTNCRTVEG